jgi:hypothetical protein
MLGARQASRHRSVTAMYYRRPHIDGIVLPAACAFASDRRDISTGGVLLEPPPQEFRSANAGGTAHRRLMCNSDGGLAFASAEPYRWMTSRSFQIGRVPAVGEARFPGTLNDSELDIVVHALIQQFVDCAEYPPTPFCFHHSSDHGTQPFGLPWCPTCDIASRYSSVYGESTCRVTHSRNGCSSATSSCSPASSR